MARISLTRPTKNVPAPEGGVGSKDSNRSAAESDSLIPPKHTIGGLGVSLLFHVALLIVMSLIMLAAEEQSGDLVTFASFADSGEPAGLELTPEPLDLAPALAGETLLASSDVMTVLPVSDFKAPEIPAMAGQGGPGGEISEIAAGIQQKVKGAGGSKGEVQFSLAWHSFNDLDLHVIVPSGQHISYQLPRSQCLGELDVDMNVQPESEEPVENVRWLKDEAPMGRFTVIVHQYRWAADHRVDEFELLVNRGQEADLVRGNVGRSSSISVHRFVYIPAKVNECRRKRLIEQFARQQESEEKKAQNLLERALAAEPGPARDQQLQVIIRDFPHTDASLRAMQELEGQLKRTR